MPLDHFTLFTYGPGVAGKLLTQSVYPGVVGCKATVDSLNTFLARNRNFVEVAEIVWFFEVSEAADAWSDVSEVAVARLKGSRVRHGGDGKNDRNSSFSLHPRFPSLVFTEFRASSGFRSFLLAALVLAPQ